MEHAEPPLLRLYTTTRCGYCVLLKRYLDYRSIPYDEVDIDHDHAAAARLERWTGGYRIVPTAVIGDRVLVNPKGSEVEGALREAGALPAEQVPG